MPADADPVQATPDDRRYSALEAYAERVTGELQEERSANTALAEENAALRSELAERTRLNFDFRNRVVEVAMRYAWEHDWCTVVHTALAELGLEPEPPVVRVDLSVRCTVRLAATHRHAVANARALTEALESVEVYPRFNGNGWNDRSQAVVHHAQIVNVDLLEEEL